MITSELEPLSIPRVNLALSRKVGFGKLPNPTIQTTLYAITAYRIGVIHPKATHLIEKVHPILKSERRVKSPVMIAATPGAHIMNSEEIVSFCRKLAKTYVKTVMAVKSNMKIRIRFLDKLFMVYCLFFYQFLAVGFAGICPKANNINSGFEPFQVHECR